MASLFVGVGEGKVSRTAGVVVKAMALGSCVGVIVLCPDVHAVGLLHVALPDASINPQKSQTLPGMFADTGIPFILREMMKQGYEGDGKLIIKLAGGAGIMEPNNIFNFGKRNILAVRKTLSECGLSAVAEDVGDIISRTVSVDVDSGRVTISSPGRGQWEL